MWSRIQEKPRRRLRLFLQLAASLAVLPGVVLLARTLTDNYQRPVPAVDDTLARFLPTGVSGFDIEPSSTPGIHHFIAKGSLLTHTGEVTSRGTLVWLASPVVFNSLPAELRESLRPSDPKTQRVERVQLMAYKVGVAEADGGKATRFFDPLGNLLFEVQDSAREEEHVVTTRLEDLGAPVVRALEAHLGNFAPTHLQRMDEYGSRVHSARWHSGHGELAIKILDNGLTLWLELPRDEPVPPEVLARTSPYGEVGALVLETYRLIDSDDRVSKTVLSNGTPIFLAERY